MIFFGRRSPSNSVYRWGPMTLDSPLPGWCRRSSSKLRSSLRPLPTGSGGAAVPPCSPATILPRWASRCRRNCSSRMPWRSMWCSPSRLGCESGIRSCCGSPTAPACRQTARWGGAPAARVASVCGSARCCLVTGWGSLRCGRRRSPSRSWWPRSRRFRESCVRGTSPTRSSRSPIGRQQMRRLSRACPRGFGSDCDPRSRITDSRWRQPQAGRRGRHRCG